MCGLIKAMTSVACHRDNCLSMIVDQDWQICSFIGQIDFICCPAKPYK